MKTLFILIAQSIFVSHLFAQTKTTYKLAAYNDNPNVLVEQSKLLQKQLLTNQKEFNNVFFCNRWKYK
jgi:hypothetical protein